MRNKKAIFFIFSVFSLFFLFNNSARAQEKNNFSFSAYTGSRLDWKSPFLPCIGATCIDFHIKRNLYTGFTNQHLWKSSTKLNLNCSLNRNSSIGFGANLGYIFGQPCEVYSKNIKSDSSEWEKLDNLGGFNQLLFSFSICYNFILSK